MHISLQSSFCHFFEQVLYQNFKLSSFIIQDLLKNWRYVIQIWLIMGCILNKALSDRRTWQNVGNNS